MKKTKLVLAALVAAAMVIGNASASIVTWDWQAHSLQGSSVDINAFGTFTTEGDALTPTAILSFEGVYIRDTQLFSITGLAVPPDGTSLFSYNQVYRGVGTPSTPFDFDGLLFETNGPEFVNFYTDVDGVLKDLINDPLLGYINTPISFRGSHESLVEPPVEPPAVDVPEPGSLALAGLALGGLFLIRRLKKVPVQT